MSDKADKAAPRTPAHRLVRYGEDRGLSLTEKIGHRLRRLQYRSFLHGLRLRGRFPLKLLAAPPDLWLGDPAVGRALIEGRLEYMGISITTHGMRFSAIQAPQAWLEWLHSFRWLRDLSAAETDYKRGAAVVEPLVQRWLSEYAKFDELAWRADVLGERLMQWMTHAPYILSSEDHVYRSSVLNALARQGRHLLQTAEKTPEGLARIKATAGLMINGLLLPGGESRTQKGAAALERALDLFILADGGIASRCPEEQLAILKILLTVRSVAQERKAEEPAGLTRAIDRLVPSLRGVMLGDNHLSAVHGGGLADKNVLEQALKLSGVSAKPLKNGIYSGFQRLEGGRSVVVLDAGPPPPGRVSQTAHAGTLAFEFSDGLNRVVVNCGGGRGTALALIPDLQQVLRASAAHSTLVIDDTNSTRIRDDGTLGKGVSEVTAVRQESEEGVLVDAVHDGYVRRFGFQHRRRLYLAADGMDFRGEDRLTGQRKRGLSLRGAQNVPFDIRFHLGPGIEATPTADNQGALIKLPGGTVWQFKVRGAALGIAPSLWIDAEGRRRKTEQLVLSGEAGAQGAVVNWSFKRSARQ
ncbi:MAG TPA: heparinase II/III family protein [Pedomonas sp.]|nr:heparinase II/III family protein [Pedomonas sp.]